MSKRNPLIFVLAIFLVIGLIFSGLAIYFYKSQQDFIKTSIKVKGRVINLIGSQNGGKAPMIEYHDKLDKTFFYTHNVYSKPSSYSLGDEVEIYYNPSFPDDARLAGDYVLIYIFGFIGSIFTLISVICIKVFFKPIKI